MKAKRILHINSSSRYNDSLTRDVSKLVVNVLTDNASTSTSRDVAMGMPVVNEEWINANFTPATERSSEQKKTLNFSDELVDELKNADHIVIASPVYNFSIPASLKTWVDLIARVGRTFSYTESGPNGLLQNKKATLVMASGGVPIGSEMDMASAYLKLLLNFIGIHDVKIIDATKININEDPDNQIAALLA